MRLAMSLLMLAIAASPGSATGRTPAAPIAESTCLSGPWALSFPAGSVALDSEHREILASVLANAPVCGIALAVIEGYPAADGSLALNRNRVMTVFRYLEEHGLPSKEVRLRLGERRWSERFQGRDRHIQIFFGVPE